MARSARVPDHRARGRRERGRSAAAPGELGPDRGSDRSDGRPGDLRPARAEVRRRLDEGQECWAAWIDGELAHWRWEATRPAFLPYLGRTLRPEGGRPLRRGCLHGAALSRSRSSHGGHVPRARAGARAWARAARRPGGVVEHPRTPRRWKARPARTVVGSVGYWTVGLGRRYFARGGVRLEGEAIVPAVRSVGAPRPGAAFPS